ncbi:hypothetical protein RclHR1_00570060 [Rhizophagus clarus]|uniref:Uncharacterized protein n=1 Tax=Rhizophagus clarus TaxID=94130 RepID=A0A2Z6RPM1_9GLOM|nr:hypothetical protein RclHR1_00570060 [Rhizophagus clarus]GET04175.1 hypothetical protein GLOIN_2v1876629 [Rhizophagus clarus]
MSQNTLQNNQNDLTFTELNNLQPTVVQPEHSSLNINYNNVYDNLSYNNNFPTFYTSNNHFDQQPSTSNGNIASTSVVSSYAPQHYVDPQQPIRTDTVPTENILNMTTINPSQSEILSFDIPGFKIIIIPTFSQQDNIYLNYSSSDILNTQIQQ